VNVGWALVAIAAALALQTALAGFLLGGTVAVDLVLVAVVGVGLMSGRVTGLTTGTIAGLAQDALSGGILGIGGLSKSLAGFLAGVVGTQFIVVQALPRFVVFFGATVLNAAVFMGLYVALGLRQYDRPVASVALQAALNALIGIVGFRVLELTPVIRERRR
jgi:rod shape-determining protein MreD